MSESMDFDLVVGGCIPSGMNDALSGAGFDLDLEGASREQNGTVHVSLSLEDDQSLKDLVGTLVSAGVEIDFVSTLGERVERGSYRRPPGTNGFFVTAVPGECDVDYGGIVPPWFSGEDDLPNTFDELLDSFRAAYPLGPVSVGWMLVDPETAEDKAARKAQEAIDAKKWAEEERKEGEARVALYGGHVAEITHTYLDGIPSERTVATYDDGTHRYRVELEYSGIGEDDPDWVEDFEYDYELAVRVCLKVFLDDELVKETHDPEEVYEVGGETVGESISDESWHYAYAFLTHAATGKAMFSGDEEAIPFRMTRVLSDGDTVDWDEFED